MASAPVRLHGFLCLENLWTVTACEWLWTGRVCLLDMSGEVALNNKGLAAEAALKLLLTTVYCLAVLFEGVLALE